MKLFEKKPILESSFWQRISGSKNSMNAFIEFNNLLAEVSAAMNFPISFMALVPKFC
jgi:hypothetical protein